MTHRQADGTDARPLRFFVRGEVFLLAEHNRPDIDRGTLINGLLKHPALEKEPQLQGALRTSDVRIVHHTFHPESSMESGQPQPESGAGLLKRLLRLLIPPRPGQNLAFIAGGFGVPGRGRGEARHVSLVFTSVREGEDLLPDEALLALAGRVQGRVPEQAAEALRSAGPEAVALHGVAPNWLASSAQGLIGTGGPGARPVPYRLPKEGDIPNRFQLEGDLDVEADGAGVDVAVLDTAPSMEALQAGYARYRQTNPLLCSLVERDGAFSVPNDRFQLRYNQHTRGGQPLMALLEDHQEGYCLEGHDYDMSDHGLFAAGIIHSIAPQASIHLVQVLNRYGVGTVETIAQGFRMVADLAADRPLVVNCSFTLNLPLPEYAAGRQVTVAWERVQQALTDSPALVKSTERALLQLIAAAEEKGAAVIAAAGNEATDGNRPPARMPAALEPVIGVGALDDAGRVAPYSNLSDTPVSEGVIAFGGAQMASGAAGSDELPEPGDRGVLGIYLGAFPPAEDGGQAPENDCGWGWWAGTSFAAPVVSGVMARLRSHGYSREVAIERIHKAFAETSAQAGGEVEQVLPARQG